MKRPAGLAAISSVASANMITELPMRASPCMTMPSLLGIMACSVASKTFFMNRTNSLACGKIRYGIIRFEFGGIFILFFLKRYNFLFPMWSFKLACLRLYAIFQIGEVENLSTQKKELLSNSFFICILVCV